MPGIDFVSGNTPVSAQVGLEAVADNPLRVCVMEHHFAAAVRNVPRKNIAQDFWLAPPIRITGRIVNAVTGEPVAGVRFSQNTPFRSLANMLPPSDKDGRFTLQIPGPMTQVYFDVYRDGFPEGIRVKMALGEQATSDWPVTDDLVIRLRPTVAVSGTLAD